MKLIWKLIIPLTIISFGLITKWWFAIPIDAPDSMLYGFPLPFICQAWHTSMAYQFFVLELLLDIIVYFSVWVLIIFAIHKFLIPILIPKSIVVIVYILAISVISLWGILIVLGHHDNVYHLKRDFEFKEIDSGIAVIWGSRKRPLLEDYR